MCFLQEKTQTTKEEPGSHQAHLPDLGLGFPIFTSPMHEPPGQKEKGTRAQGTGIEASLPTVQFVDVTLNHANILYIIM